MVKIFSLFMINLLTSFRYKVNFIASTLSILVPVIPALLLLLNGDLSIFGFADTKEYAVYLFIAATVWSGVEIIWSFTFQMRSQMQEGILDETLMQPLSISQIIIGWTLDGIISTFIQSIPLFIISAVFLISSQSILNVLAVIIIILLSYFCGFCMATILIAIMVNWKETDQMVSFIGNIAPFICGVIVPISYIPSPIKFIGSLFPFTWGLDIIRTILFKTPPMINLKMEILIFFTLIVIYYFLGKKLFKILYNRSRKNGGVVGY